MEAPPELPLEKQLARVHTVLDRAMKTAGEVQDLNQKKQILSDLESQRVRLASIEASVGGDVDAPMKWLQNGMYPFMNDSRDELVRRLIAIGAFDAAEAAINVGPVGDAFKSRINIAQRRLLVGDRKGAGEALIRTASRLQITVPGPTLTGDPIHILLSPQLKVGDFGGAFATASAVPNELVRVAAICEVAKAQGIAKQSAASNASFVKATAVATAMVDRGQRDNAQAIIAAARKPQPPAFDPTLRPVPNLPRVGFRPPPEAFTQAVAEVRAGKYAEANAHLDSIKRPDPSYSMDANNGRLTLLSEWINGETFVGQAYGEDGILTTQHKWLSEKTTTAIVDWIATTRDPNLRCQLFALLLPRLLDNLHGTTPLTFVTLHPATRPTGSAGK
jgi:hypothetical protein